MHAGFVALRMELPMNCDGPRTGVQPSLDAQADIERIIILWRDCRSRGSAGPWLFGNYGVVDAMFAPVVLRFSTYRVALPDDAQAYVATVLADPALREWVAAGRAEREIIEGAERGQLCSGA